MMLSVNTVYKMVIEGKKAGLSDDDLAEKMIRERNDALAADKAISTALKQAIGPVLRSLSDMPDGIGCFYGELEMPDGARGTFNVIPPVEHWTGDNIVEGFAPHDEDWKALLNGDLIAQSPNIETLGASVQAALNPDPKD